MAEQTPGLRLLSRPECGLCKDMARDLNSLQISFDTIDIDQDESLLKTYGEVIPVLLLGEQEVARAPQTPASLRDSLRRVGLLPIR
jgi:glutaredoxin